MYANCLPLFYSDSVTPDLNADPSIRILSGIGEQNLARAIFDEVWPSDEGTQITANLLQAMVHNGTYLAGVFIEDEIVAAAFAFPSFDKNKYLHLHSHMTAVKESCRNRNIGTALKFHQKAWALDHGYETITWTFDPLVRRNAKLNLVKLGVQVFDYFSDFYGNLPDNYNVAVNGNHKLIGKILQTENEAEQLQLAKQAFDLALLSQGMLTGAELTEFVNRSVSLI